MNITSSVRPSSTIQMLIEQGMLLDEVNLFNYSEDGGVNEKPPSCAPEVKQPIVDQIAMICENNSACIQKEYTLRNRFRGLTQNYWDYITNKMKYVKLYSKDADDCYKKLRDEIRKDIDADEKVLRKMADDCYEKLRDVTGKDIDDDEKDLLKMFVEGSGFIVISNHIPDPKDNSPLPKYLDYINNSKKPGPLFQFIQYYTLTSPCKKQLPFSEGVPYALRLVNGSVGIVIPYTSKSEQATRGLIFFPYGVLDQMIADIVEKEYNQKIKNTEQILQDDMKRYGFKSIGKMLNCYHQIDLENLKRATLWPWLYTGSDFGR